MGQGLFGGIEAGGTKFRCAIGDSVGTILTSTTIPTRAPSETLRDVVEFFRFHESKFPIEAIGIASFGPIELRPHAARYGQILSTPKLEWRNYDILGHLARSTGVVDIAFDTDVNAAAYGESKWGAGRDMDPLLYMTMGTGIGGGIVANGEILHGLLHPEMGHMRIPRQPGDTFAGCCPAHADCFEGLASGKAMALRWSLPAHELPRHHHGWVLETRYAAQALANLILTLSPKRVILGGGLTNKLAWGLLRESVRDLINGYVNAPELKTRIGEYIVRPGLGDDSGVVGAIALAAARYARSDASQQATSAHARPAKRPTGARPHLTTPLQRA